MKQVALVAYAPARETAGEAQGCIMAWELPSLTPLPHLQLKEMRLASSEWAAPVPNGLEDSAFISLFSSSSSASSEDSTANAILVHGMGRERPVLRSFGQDKLTAMQATGEGLVVGNARGVLSCWCLRRGTKLWQREGAHLRRITAIRRSLRGQLVTAGEDGCVRVWQELASGPQLRLELPTAKNVADLCVAGDRLYALVGDSVEVYDLLDDLLLARLRHPAEGLTRLAVDATECMLLVGNQAGEILVWDLTALTADTLYASSNSSFLLKGHEAAIVGLSLSLDGAWAVSLDRLGGLGVWDLATRSLLRRLETPPRGYTQATGLWLSTPAGGYQPLGFTQLQREVAPLDEAVCLKPSPAPLETASESNLQREYEQLKQAYAKLLQDSLNTL